MGIRIVSDSSSDLLELDGVDYKTVPLKIMFGGREYVDEIGTDFEQMVLDLQEHDGPSTTSCPNAQEWLDAFEGSDEVFAVTISSGLSASYDSAMMAKQLYEETHPKAKVHVFDSLATGPVIHLIINHVKQGILEGKSYEEILIDTVEYKQRLRILYSLKSLKNLANNGRVNKHVARIAGALNIYVIGHASNEGQVEIIHKCKGLGHALRTMVREMGERGFAEGPVIIDHCLNEKAAKKLKTMIERKYPLSTVEIVPCTALCSYYADMGGIILGYAV